MYATGLIQDCCRKICVILLSASIALVGTPVGAQQLDPETVKRLQELERRGGEITEEQRSRLDQVRERRQRETEDRERQRRDDADRRQAEEETRASTEEADLSRLERDYQSRTNNDIRQYGYDIFEMTPAAGELTTGRVPDDYVLGVGDELVINLHGSTQRSIVTKVDREGQVVIPDLKPISAAGRTFGEFQEVVKSRTEAALLGTEAYVSVGAVRMISVFVLGEVENPGIQRLTSLSTALEALAATGGIKKTGSLRNVKIRRAGAVKTFDIYDVLGGEPGEAPSLRDGDQIIVPVVGSTIAVTGEVKRQGIYELPPSRDSVPVSEAVEQAGGTLRPRGYAYSLNHIGDSGRQIIQEVTGNQTEIEDGDILSLQLRENVKVGAVTLLGHVRVKGDRSLDAAPTMSQLVDNVDQLQPNPYLPFAVIETTDPNTRTRILKEINLERVLTGKGDYQLHDKDRIYIFGLKDIEFLSSSLVQQVIISGKTPKAAERVAVTEAAAAEFEEGMESEEAACAGLRRVARVVTDTRSNRFATAVSSVAFETVEEFQGPARCPEIFGENEDLLPFLLEHVVAIGGTVRRPGIYPITGETNLASLIDVAGGIMKITDLTSVEYLEYVPTPETGTSRIDRHTINLVHADAAELMVSPGSGFRFNQILSQQESGGVLLTGEFVRPGFYMIRRGEQLSSVIERAGGLTSQAYPYGALFTRESAKERQEQGFRRAARELNTALAVAALREETDAAGVAAAREAALQLATTEAAGRIVIEAAPTVLEVRPGLDIILQPGDRLHMPKRPGSVTVSGDILNPGTLQFVPGKNVKSYLSEAGGFQSTADKGRVFVVYPNGEAEPVTLSSLSFSKTPSIPPGTTIVVPKDLQPFDWFRFSRDLTQILSQLAISAAALATINN